MSKGRFHRLGIPIFALTGSIGTGKSTVLHYLKDLRHPCLDADQLIKLIYQKEETKKFIADLDPHFISHQQVDFPQLRKAFFNNKKIKKQVQSYLYERIEEQFCHELKKQGDIPYLFYDIPLLFEQSLQDQFDCTITVYCSQKKQLKRIIERDQIPEELARKIMASQMDIEKKRLYSDYTLDNTSTKEALYRQTDQLLKQLLAF